MLSKEKNKFVTRLEKLQRHLVPLISSDETQKNEQKKQAILELWKDLNAATKLTVALLVPVGVYYGYCTVNGIPPIEMVTLSLDTYSQAVSLYALRKMHSQLKENLGVSRTLTRSYQLLSFVGSGIYTTSLLGSINTNFGKSNFIFNLLHTLGYGYFVYLTLLYNYELPDPRDARKMRGVVDWNSLFGFIVVMSFTLYFWIKELSQASITSGNRYNILAMMGFIMTSFGVLRGGFKAAVTSIPVISPFAAVAPLACATILNTLTKLPQFTTSPVMRTYVVGYFAISYCLVMIAFLALKEERRKREHPNNLPLIF